MTVRDTSRMALEAIRDKLSSDEQKVYEILLEIGPACDRRILEALNQKESASFKPKKARRQWEINSVTGRRNSLYVMDHVDDLGKYKGQFHGKNKTYHFWRVRGDDRLPTGWVKAPDKARDHKLSLPVVEEPGKDMSTSEAGRVLVAARRRRKTKAKLSFQLQLF